MSIDFSLDGEPADLVDAIWAARRAQRRDLVPEILGLLEHDVPTVREEVISLVFAKWRESSERHLLERTIRDDADTGVRARAVGALATISEPSTLASDIATLRDIVLNRHEEEQVRKAAYEGLVLLVRNDPSPIDDATDLDEDINLDWVRSL